MQAARSFESRVLSQLLQTRTSIPKARRYPLPHRSISTNFRPLHARQATRSRPHLPQSQSHPLRAARSLRLSSTKANAEAASSATLSARLKKLSREYGWSALGVYLLLSALDFPFCFLGVRLLGTERIGRWEHNVVEGVKSLISWPLKAEQTLEAGGPGPAYGGEREQRLLDEQVVEERWDHGVEEAEKANSGEGASIWTQLALAYAIHKSFIFIRVPLTAAVTPKVVKTLRSWGWDIGKRRPPKPVPGAGVNAERTGVNTGKK